METSNKKIAANKKETKKPFASDITPNLDKLRGYTQSKLALADLLRIIRDGLAGLGRKQPEEQIGELMVKLAEDRFTLAVLGQFKRGKSSLMNAITGLELLPTGVLPLTSAITILKYGPTERLLVNRSGLIYPAEVPVETLFEYVTEKYNPNNEKNVKSVCIELPVPFLRYGIEFVDTPGVGSSIHANTATTYGFLPECDAVLFVTGVDTPMTSTEIEFLKEINAHVDRIFFVINKIDLINTGEKEEILEFVNHKIREVTGYSAPKIFPVSSKDGLEARRMGDTELYERCGLKTLEDALGLFLSEEKSSAFLAAVSEKAIRILTEERGAGVFEDDYIQSYIKKLEEEKSPEIHQEPKAAALAISDAWNKLTSLKKGVMPENTQITTHPGKAENIAVIKPKIKVEIIAAKPGDMNKDLHTRTCPVCRHLAEEASNFYAYWQYKLSTDQQIQAEFAIELGFCPLHTWQLFSMSSPYGTSIGYASLSERIAGLLKQEEGKSNSSGRLKKLVRNPTNCRVCNLLRQSEEKYIHALVDILKEDEGRSDYKNSQGACLWHLGMLLSVSPAEMQKFLLSHAIALFGRDAEDMRSYAMKYDALRRTLHNKNEEDAYKRAIIRMVGDKNICMPWSQI